MCKFWLVVCVIITQIRFITGHLPKHDRIREFEVRLIGGHSSFEGRIEIWYNNTWGTVCDDRFDSKDAAVICHMLGFQRLGARPYNQAAYGEGSGSIWLDELKCNGDELSVKDCPHSPWGSHDCSHIEDAGVKCQAKQTKLEYDKALERKEKDKIPNRYMSNKKNAVNDPTKRWKNNIVYYSFGEGIDSKTEILIRDALEEWSLYSCIAFKKDDSEYNKIVFNSEEHETECGTPYAGMKQGSQEIHLGKDCFYRDVILHEVGHALGFYHEHNRPDRNNYITVHYENITKGKEYSFNITNQTQYEDYDKPYDYKSIMHYGQYSFSKNVKKGLITIETRDPEFQDVIGKAKDPSFLDYKILNYMFKCADRCANIDCPDGFLGQNCVCYCEGKDTPIQQCSKKDDCPNPSVDQDLFAVLDKGNLDVDMNRTHFPDKTLLKVYSINQTCKIVSPLECDDGTWRGSVRDCPDQLELQFIDGSENEDIVEAVMNEQRGYICDDDWDDNDATVACRMMGFKFGKARFEIRPKVNKSIPILLDDMKCNGSELTLSECMHNVWGKHDCTYEELAAVTCFDDRLIKNTDTVSDYDCGNIPLKDSKRRKRQARIVRGFEAVTGMNPWQVEIQRRKGRWQHWCGGTIISSHWILSAAHCFGDLRWETDGRDVKAKYEDFRVYIGDNDRMTHGDHEQGFRIEYLVKHWEYKEKDGFFHDIALLKIKSESGDGAIFNDYVQPACLPGENEPLNYGMKCEVSGWGQLMENKGEKPVKLISVKVPIVDEKKCKKPYNESSQSVFCAGGGRHDACYGDSGGPLVCELNDKNTVNGIAFWGEGCGRPDSPGLYVNVSAYISWIKQQISLHDSAIMCPKLEDIMNGELVQDSTDNFGRVARYTCNSGYSLNNNPKLKVYKRYCQADGTWDGKQPTCDGTNNLFPTRESQFLYTRHLLNECLLDPELCLHGKCVNTDGSYRCECLPGYGLDSTGRICVDHDECANRDMCRGGICSNTVGSFKCTCDTGFEPGQQEICEDINECDGQLNQCAFRCFNTEGSFRCICPMGYQVSADSIHCEDVDECSTSANQCRYTCKNLIGTFMCICPEGFRETGRDQCTDIDECREQRNLCQPGGRCINTQGGFRCDCYHGYRSNAEGNQCLDPREDYCYMESGRCRPWRETPRTRHASCCCAGAKAWGRRCEICPRKGTKEYRTLCPSGGGYDPDGSDIDECRMFPNLCVSGRCLNTAGSYRCVCIQGYKADTVTGQCVDTDECAEGGACDHVCQNMIGSYTCGCLPGYVLNMDGKTCRVWIQPWFLNGYLPHSPYSFYSISNGQRYERM